MQLGRLDEICQEIRRAEIRAMEELAGDREAVEPECALARAAEQRIEHDRRGRGIGEDLNRAESAGSGLA